MAKTQTTSQAPAPETTSRPAAGDAGKSSDDDQPATAALVDRARLLSPQACQRRFKTFPTLIGDVRIRNLTEAERSQFETDIVDDDLDADRDRLVDAKRRLIVLCVVDADGNPPLSADDVDALGQVDAAITGQIYDEAHAFCGFKRGDIEALVKNCSGGPAVDSP